MCCFFVQYHRPVYKNWNPKKHFPIVMFVELSSNCDKRLGISIFIHFCEYFRPQALTKIPVDNQQDWWLDKTFTFCFHFWKQKGFAENLAPPPFPRLLHPGMKPLSISLQACTKARLLGDLERGRPPLLVFGRWPQPSRRCLFGATDLVKSC